MVSPYEMAELAADLVVTAPFVRFYNISDKAHVGGEN